MNYLYQLAAHCTNTLARTRRRLARAARDDTGATLIIVMLLIGVLASLGPVIVGQITGNTGLLTSTTDQHAALEAADAGVQWYENHLNTDPDYFSNPSSTDAAIGNGNWCTSGTSGCGLPASTPPEAFHYTPSSSSLYSSTGASAGEQLLTVTGRAGTPHSYSYATMLVGFRRSSILDNAYFSNYELLDPNVIRSYVDDGGTAAAPYMVTASTTSGGRTTSSQESVLAATVNDAGNSVSLWNALCAYYTYSPNTFIDSLGTVPTNGTPQYYSATYPYYGPFVGLYGWSANSAPNLQFAQNGTTITVASTGSFTSGGICGGNFEFINGDTFNGPVYTEDQLHICGDPAFEGAPVSLTSGASSNLEYAYQAPESVAVTSRNAGTGETYPTSSVGGYAPGGVLNDCSGNNPTYAHGGNGGPALNGNESMPQTNAQLATTAEAATGCIYYGPTMIQLVTVSGHTTMDVWSPLSTAAAGTQSDCGTFSSSSPYVTGISLPSNGVIYVTGSGSTAGVSVPDCVDANDDSTTGSSGNSGNSNCTAGTAFVEGELSGQLTIGAANNIIITRDITYNCASGAGPASSSDPASVSACTNASPPDVLGLDADQDVIMARPSLGSNPSYCAYDGTGALPVSPGGSQTTVQQEENDGLPNCEMQNPIVDAAIVATQGSFGDQSYDQGQADGNLYLNGTDVSDYRGPFGTFGGNCNGPNNVCSGYNKVFSFDSRLAFLTPPGMLNISNAMWQEVNATSCGDVDTEFSVSCPSLP